MRSRVRVLLFAQAARAVTRAATRASFANRFVKPY